MLACVLIGHMAFGAAAGLHLAGWLEALELLAYDQGLRWRADLAAHDSRITIIGVTEQDLLAQGWPLDDAVLAEVVSEITRLGARAIGIDIYRDFPVPPGTDRLDEVLRSSDSVYWIYRFGDDRDPGTPAPVYLHEQGRTGFADVPLDVDGRVRRALLFLDRAGAFGVSMPLAVALRFLELTSIRLEPAPDSAFARIGPTIFPPFEPDDGGYRGADAAGYQVLLDFAQGTTPFDAYTVGNLLAGRVPAEALADRLVFVGTTADTVKDTFDVPLEGDRVQGSVSGVVLHALIASQLLRNVLDGTPLTSSAGEAGELAWIWIWCLLGAAWGTVATTTRRSMLGLVIGAALVGAVWYAALAAFVWLPLAAPILGWAGATTLAVAWSGQSERRARATLMQLFATHVSPAVAEEIWARRDLLLREGRPRPRRLVATVLFSDIEDFTPISERLDPDDVTDWLDAYLTVMTGLVASHGGVVLRFIGDAILAVFGAPIPRLHEAEIDADAAHASACALAMRDALEELNRGSDARGLPPVRMRIGINTGEMVAGSIGSADRMEYTVLGDPVNVAARLEAFAKRLPAKTGIHDACSIAVSDATWQRLGDRFVGVFVGREALKGKSQEIGVHQLVDRVRVDSTGQGEKP